MSKPFSIRLEGLDKTLNKLKELDTKVSRAVDSAIETNALEIAGAARRLAPVDLGKLRASIGSGRIKFMEFEVFANAEYAPYIEFGTGGAVKIPVGLETYAEQFKGKGIREVTIRPQPFLFPAVMAYRKQLIRDIKEALKTP